MINERLKVLTDKLGILSEFYDAGQDRKKYEISEDIMKFFVSKLGYKADTAEDIERSIKRFDNQRYETTLSPVYVVDENDKVIDIVTRYEDRDTIKYIRAKSRQDGKEMDLNFEYQGGEERDLHSGKFTCQKFKIHTDLAVGYYDITVSAGGEEYKSVLAVAPRECYKNNDLESSKLWGYATQLYAMKSKRNWGVGDFTDLKNFVDVCAKCGADVIGLNPLNILEHNYPENASPYLSVSRLFLNPIYIDIENVPEFKKEDLRGIEDKLNEYRNSDIIRYEDIYPLKMQFMEKFYARFKEGKDKKRQEEYKAYCEREGAELEKLAVFLAMYEERCHSVWGGWRAWEEKYRSPSNPAVKEYAEEHKDRVGFFKFLQFEADRQFKEAADEVKKKGLKIGFYRDLAVGVGQDSAESWSNPDIFIAESGAGAPPDACFPGGQKWGLGAFSPYVLKQKAYEPFIQILRANMRNTGALRIDHVMSLMRLYVIPNEGKQGTYIMYNFADMLNIVAIESYLNKCVVAGESLGNVPDGFLEALENKNIYALSVLWAERNGGGGWSGDFLPPSAYPERAFTSIGTHDMAPLKMWWFGYDIADMRKADILPNDEVMKNNYHDREQDRWRLLCALDAAGVWPKDRLRKGNYLYGEAYPEGMAEAVNAFVSSSPSKVFLAELENILEVDKRQNLPGVDRDKHPNWRRRLPIDLEDFEGNEMFRRNVEVIKKNRCK